MKLKVHDCKVTLNEGNNVGTRGVLFIYLLKETE